MKTKSALIATLVASLGVSACSTPLVQNGVTLTKNISPLNLLSEKPETPVPAAGPLDVSWRILSSPAQIVPVTASNAGRSSKIDGHAAIELAPHPTPKRYHVSWTGLRDTHAENPTKITLRDATGARAVVLQFEADQLRVFAAEEDPFARRTYATTTTHEVRMILNLGPNPSVAIGITEGGAQLYHTHPLEFADATFGRLDVVEIDAATAEGSYQISDFRAVPKE